MHLNRTECKLELCVPCAVSANLRKRRCESDHCYPAYGIAMGLTIPSDVFFFRTTVKDAITLGKSILEVADYPW